MAILDIYLKFRGCIHIENEVPENKPARNMNSFGINLLFIGEASRDKQIPASYGLGLYMQLEIQFTQCNICE